MLHELSDCRALMSIFAVKLQDCKHRVMQQS